MFHTVYDSFESGPGGRDYVGKHSSMDPYDNYLGSYRDKSFSPDGKIIIAYAKTPEGAVWLEIQFQKVFGVVEDHSSQTSHIKQTVSLFMAPQVKTTPLKDLRSDKKLVKQS